MQGKKAVGLTIRVHDSQFCTYSMKLGCAPRYFSSRKQNADKDDLWAGDEINKTEIDTLIPRPVPVRPHD